MRAPSARSHIDTAWFWNRGGRASPQGVSMSVTACPVLARILGELTGPEGLVGRIGGDEFAVALHPATPSSAREFAEKLLAEIRLLRVTAGVHTIRVTASIGIARCPADAQTANALYQATGTRLYDQPFIKALEKG